MKVLHEEYLESVVDMRRVCFSWSGAKILVLLPWSFPELKRTIHTYMHQIRMMQYSLSDDGWSKSSSCLAEKLQITPYYSELLFLWNMNWTEYFEASFELSKNFDQSNSSSHLRAPWITSVTGNLEAIAMGHTSDLTVRQIASSNLRKLPIFEHFCKNLAHRSLLRSSNM